VGAGYFNVSSHFGKASRMYLIRRPVPRELGSIYEWSLVVIKASDGASSCQPYLAFETRAAALEALSLLAPGPEYEVVDASKLSLNTYVGRGARALVFGSAQHLHDHRSGTNRDYARWEPMPSPRLFVGFARLVKDWRVGKARAALARES